MKYPKREIEVIPECNDENDEPTVWSMKFYWNCDCCDWIYICKYSEHEYKVETAEGFEISEHSYKTLAGAKRYAEAVCWRRENS